MTLRELLHEFANRIQWRDETNARETHEGIDEVFSGDTPVFGKTPAGVVDADGEPVAFPPQGA